MKKLFALITLITLTITGCSDSTELGGRAIIQAAAVDYDGQYHVTAMLFSSGGSGGNTIDASQENVIRVSGDGDTLSQAIDSISLIDGKRIYMCETKLLILGSGFKNKNALDAIKTLYYDLRCSLNMPVCCVDNGESAEGIVNLQFTEGITSADKPLSLIENAYRMGVSPKTTLLDMLADSACNRDTLLPMFSIIENGSGVTVSDDNKTAVLSGSRYFSNGILREPFDKTKTAALMLITGKSNKITLNYHSDNTEKTCEAYCIKVTTEPGIGENIHRVSAKFRTRNGGMLSESERKAAISELAELIGSNTE
ncbi:MAG: hypothetical protein MR364_01360 [Oscillospiraceae bacterium]|nr:hypothetical protein [Oscillospiraceae bacterium]